MNTQAHSQKDRQLDTPLIFALEQLPGQDRCLSCPGCLIQIKDRLGTDTRHIESVHPIELVAKTYGD